MLCREMFTRRGGLEIKLDPDAQRLSDLVFAGAEVYVGAAWEGSLDSRWPMALTRPPRFSFPVLSNRAPSFGSLSVAFCLLDPVRHDS